MFENSHHGLWRTDCRSIASLKIECFSETAWAHPAVVFWTYEIHELSIQRIRDCSVPLIWILHSIRSWAILIALNLLHYSNHLLLLLRWILCLLILELLLLQPCRLRVFHPISSYHAGLDFSLPVEGTVRNFSLLLRIIGIVVWRCYLEINHLRLFYWIV